VKKSKKERSRESQGWSSTPASTRDRIWKRTESRLMAPSVTELVLLLAACCASFSLWLTPPFCFFPQNPRAQERLCCRSPGSLSRTARSPWSIIEEQSLCFMQLKPGAASVIASIFLELQGIIHMKQW